MSNRIHALRHVSRMGLGLAFALALFAASALTWAVAEDEHHQTVADREGDHEHAEARDGDREHAEERHRDREHAEARDGDREHAEERHRDREHAEERDGDREHAEERHRDREHAEERDGDREEEVGDRAPQAKIAALRKARLTLGQAIAVAERRTGGRALEAEYEFGDERVTIEVELITRDGRMAEATFDALTRRLIELDTGEAQAEGEGEIRRGDRDPGPRNEGEGDREREVRRDREG